MATLAKSAVQRVAAKGARPAVARPAARRPMRVQAAAQNQQVGGHSSGRYLLGPPIPFLFAEGPGPLFDRTLTMLSCSCRLRWQPQQLACQQWPWLWRPMPRPHRRPS
jgi:hypothetical protein